MAATKLQGKVTNLYQSTEARGASNQVSGYVRTYQVLTFRVNNRQVAHQMPTGYMGISEGDDVTLIGGEKSGTVQVWCIRNDTTGAVMYAPTWLGFVVGAFFLLIGTPLMFAGDGAIYFGLPLAAIGAYFVHKGWRVWNANAELKATRPITAGSMAAATL